jgi:hypothetical protein
MYFCAQTMAIPFTVKIKERMEGCGEVGGHEGGRGETRENAPSVSIDADYECVCLCEWVCCVSTKSKREGVSG